MIDIHTHILPAIDDGATDAGEALKMCELATNLGCTAMIATPHQRHPLWWNTERMKLEILLDRLQKTTGDTIDLHLGAEIRVGKGFMRDLENFDNSGLASLAGSDYLLLEFERRELSVDPIEIVERVQAAGWRPIVAHPELIERFVEDLELAKTLVDTGALLQITGTSITGEFGLEPKERATALMESGLVHFVASDCHGHRHRPPGLKSAFAKIANLFGRDYATRLMIDNPKAVIENRRVEPLSLGTAAV